MCNLIIIGELENACVAAACNALSLTGSQNGHQRLRLTGVCGCQWPVTALGMNNEPGQLGTALGHNGERRSPPESSCYCCLLTATIEASVREKDGRFRAYRKKETYEIMGRGHRGRI